MYEIKKAFEVSIKTKETCVYQTHHMDEVCEDPGCLGVSEGARSVLWFVLRQQTIVEKRVVSPDPKLVGVLEMYASDDAEVLAREHHLLIGLVFPIGYIFV